RKLQQRHLRPRDWRWTGPHRPGQHEIPLVGAMLLKLTWILSLAGPALPALLDQEPTAWQATPPTARFSISHVEASPDLSLDPQSAVWKNAKSALMVKDCSRTLGYPDLKTEIRGFWT